MGGGSNNCERSEQTERLHEAFTGMQGLAPWRGLQSAPSRKKILYFASYMWILSGPLWSKFTEIYDLGGTSEQLNFAS